MIVSSIFMLNYLFFNNLTQVNHLPQVMLGIKVKFIVLVMIFKILLDDYTVAFMSMLRDINNITKNMFWKNL